jgi:hypothetical protein
MEDSGMIEMRRIRALAVAALLAATLLCASAPGATAAQPLSNLRLVNYVPSADGWGSMWWSWNPAQMAVDFKRIAALHANAVRIILSAPAFGFPHPSQTMASRLSRTLSLAAAAGLRVQLTLFNEWRDYEDTADSRTWAAEVLAPLRGRARLGALDGAVRAVDRRRYPGHRLDLDLQRRSAAAGALISARERSAEPL